MKRLIIFLLLLVSVGFSQKTEYYQQFVSTDDYGNVEEINHYERKGDVIRYYKREIFYPNGQLKESWRYKDDKIHGPYIGYSYDGKKRLEGQFVDGKEDGLWKRVDNGRVVKKLRYKDGKEID